MAIPRRLTDRGCARQRPVVAGVLAGAAGGADFRLSPRVWTLATGGAVAGSVSRAVAGVPRPASWYWWGTAAGLVPPRLDGRCESWPDL